ncbi:Plasmodium exported protein, unknown function [Plasmodium knowlesi strain H]|uniref:Uncharacterized protein n=3 Tax=Plasmodium knowlesi TaxID=5850 RepID=A0A679L8K2_PLAKH|nr:Plasmodium exported protein, unknown function [Plasmodium knowlesi strain H]OTN63666.1 Uncharacterized protein PKNOH_S140291600 [Plasmodium knowlesi]CAA9991324.1 Plasmodium exported protein, unknown function [Plasmodium knowlesi strain H]SBO28969.1 Plasmodium exported protein, unknown function [Plasmodium knowlesi strain H]VVS80798.1 Plasmodium exported protein, unknown function [Plasmodium knowlesi strain H]
MSHLLFSKFFLCTLLLCVVLNLYESTSSSVCSDHRINQDVLTNKCGQTWKERISSPSQNKNLSYSTKVEQQNGVLEYTTQRYGDPKYIYEQNSVKGTLTPNGDVNRVVSNELDNVTKLRNIYSYSGNSIKEDVRTNNVQENKPPQQPEQPQQRSTASPSSKPPRQAVRAPPQLLPSTQPQKQSQKQSQKQAAQRSTSPAAHPVDTSKGGENPIPSILNELKETLLIRPQVIETKLKNLEQVLLDKKLITESKLNEVKEVLSDSELIGKTKKKRNVWKVLKENFLSNPSIRELMLKELEDILLGNELNTEYILKILNKNKFSNRLAYLPLLNIFGRFIISKKLMEESKLKELKGVLLSDKPITEPQLHELKVFLVDILYNISNINNNVESQRTDDHDDHMIRAVPREIDAYYFSERFDSTIHVDERYPDHHLLQNVHSFKNRNEFPRTESFNADPFVRRANLKRRENLTLAEDRSRRNIKKDSIYRKNVSQKADLIRKNELLKKKFLSQADLVRTSILKRDNTIFLPQYNDPIDDNPSIDRREILQRNELIKKIPIKLEVTPKDQLPEKDVAEKVHVNIAPKDPLPKKDGPEKVHVNIAPKDQLPKKDGPEKVHVNIAPKDPLPKKDVAEKVHVNIPLKDPLPKKDMAEKVHVNIPPKDPLPKKDVADKGDKNKIEQITKKKQWTIEIHMSEKKKNDEIITNIKKEKKTTIISTHMCEKTKKGELMDDILASKNEDERIGKEKVASRKKFIVDVHLQKKEKKGKPVIKEKKWMIKAIMKNIVPKKELEVLEELPGSRVIDVNVKDPLCPQTQEAIFESILANPLTKPSKRKRRIRLLRKLAIYGIVPTLAIGAIIGFTIGYIHVAPIDVVLDAAALGVRTTVSSVAQGVPQVASTVGQCAVEAASATLSSSNSFFTIFSNVLFNTAKCALNSTVAAAEVVVESTFNGAAVASSYGTLYGVLQGLFPSFIAVGILVLIYILFLYLDERGKMEWFHRYRKKFIKKLKRKYNEFKMSRQRRRRKWYRKFLSEMDK